MSRHSALEHGIRQLALLKNRMIGLSFGENWKEIPMIRKLLLVCIALVLIPAAKGKVVVKEVSYKAGDTDMKGFVAYDDETTSKRPGVLVIPEWWGNNDYPKSRAKQLAELGFVAFAADMYGGGKTTDDPKQAGDWATQVKKNPELDQTRFDAALDQLKQQPNVDPEKLGAIGYCFGGTVVLNAARRNEPLKGVVSFHGDLSTDHPAAGSIAPRVLVCTGDADSFVPPPQVQAFENEMSKVSANSQIKHYANAHHSFTNPNADSHHMDNIKYDADADKKSWEDMKSFFADVFK
jgi:dienelactone hydrolase